MLFNTGFSVLLFIFNSRGHHRPRSTSSLSQCLLWPGLEPRTRNAIQVHPVGSADLTARVTTCCCNQSVHWQEAESGSGFTQGIQAMQHIAHRGPNQLLNQCQMAKAALTLTLSLNSPFILRGGCFSFKPLNPTTKE